MSGFVILNTLRRAPSFVINTEDRGDSARTLIYIYRHKDRPSFFTVGTKTHVLSSFEKTDSKRKARTSKSQTVFGILTFYLSFCNLFSNTKVEHVLFGTHGQNRRFIFMSATVQPLRLLYLLNSPNSNTSYLLHHGHERVHLRKN